MDLQPVPGRFAGSVALVTGAASGVGRATTRRLVAEGAEVLAVDISADGLAAVQAELGAAVRTAAVDIGSRAACHDTVGEAIGAFGRLSVLANVAGRSWAHHVTDVTEDEWRAMFSVNLDAVFWLSQAAIPHLLATAGCIVNVASNAGLMGQAYTVPYCASKGAVVNLTRAMAMEYVKTGLRVNCVAPGGMNTAMTAHFQMPEDVDFELLTPYIGYRGMGEPEDAASAICWLASSDARRCTGTILSIDGGLTAG